MKKKKNCPDGRTKFATTQQSYSSVQCNSSAGRNSTNGQDDDTGTGGLTTKMDQVTGDKNSSDVDTSWPDRHQHQVYGGV